MATTYTSKKLAFNSAEQFKESFAEPQPSIGYLFIGNHLPWTNEDSPDSIIDDVADEKTVWDNMYAARRVSGNDVELVVPRYLWSANNVYRHYDDRVELDYLISSNVTLLPAGVGFYEDLASYANSKPMYVMNSERNVYICLNNSESSNSTVEPSGKNLSSNGNIQTSDGYTWKYLYNVRASSKFLTDEWMPVPTSTAKLDYDTSSLISVDGELTYLEVMNTGSGFIHSEISVLPFLSGTNIITVANTNNLVANMSVSGTGITGGSYITNIDTLNLKIRLSANTSANGGGSGNTVSVTTRVFIDGDGTGAIPVANVTNGGINKIVLTTYGKDYTRANVYIYGTGTDCNVRAVLPPKYGHGYNSAKELGASNVMVAMKIGEIDTTEGGLISSNTTFRQYGLLADPHKYGSNTVISSSNANTVISQTTDLTIISGSYYNTDEYVYQGPSANAATFSGYVNNQDSNIVRLSKTIGTPAVGVPLKGASTNPTGRAVVVVDNPEFEPHTGDILYVNNITKTQRTEGQAESIKFVVRF
jgi:hypothetical protein